MFGQGFRLLGLRVQGFGFGRVRVLGVPGYRA